MVLSVAAFSQNIEGKWTNTIDTDNWPFTFFAEYEVDGETEITMTAVKEE